MLKKIFKGLSIVFGWFGFKPEIGVRNLRAIPWFFKDFRRFKKLKSSNDDLPFGLIYPVLDERHLSGGNVTNPYFHQDLHVAQRIFRNAPEKHVDIGSRVDGFVTHVASFREIELFDIREVKSFAENISFQQVDVMNLDERFHSYTDSLSSLHVVEHFGLGRYGDEIDPEGHLKGLDNILKMLKQGGRFYFSTPLGPQRINFNAHRVFSAEYLKELFLPNYEILAFSYIDDQCQIHKDIPMDHVGWQDSFGCNFGVAIFEMIKR